jgi:hypothetical protein
VSDIPFFCQLCIFATRRRQSASFIDVRREKFPKELK